MTIAAELDRAGHRIAIAERVVPHVLDALDERRANLGASGRPEIPALGGGISDPTAHLAAALADIDRHRKLIAQGVELIHAAINHLDLMSRNALGGHQFDAEDAPRCPGYPIGQDCGDLTTYTLDERHGPVLRSDRLCDRCARESMADERRRRQELDAKRQRIGVR